MNYKIKRDCRDMMADEIVDAIFSDRGITDVDTFLNPTEDMLLPDLPETYTAMRWLLDSIKHNDKICILFDVDLDGISAGAIMTRYLRDLGVKTEQRINDWKKHGVQKENLEDLCQFDLLIIVDSLDSTIDNYKYLTDHTTSVIVLDHHAINPSVPYSDYVCLVSSQYEEYQNKALSGAGVVWKFCKAIDNYKQINYADKYMDLAACGLVADMMDMAIPENRYIVSRGLNGLTNLAVKKIVGSYPFNSTAIAFSVAPLVNAANRLNKNQDAMMAFLSDDNKEVLKYIRIMKKCKEEQNEEVSEMMTDIEKQCSSQLDKKMITVFVDTPNGITGLIGNKLLEKYKRPILILKDTGDTYSGSMRSVGTGDFMAIINESGLARADGHEYAAGFEMPKCNLKKFNKYIEEKLVDFKTDVDVEADVQIGIHQLNSDLIDRIKSIDRISGNGFRPIRFYIDDIDEYNVSFMGEGKHLIIEVQPNIDVIKWNFSGDTTPFEDGSWLGSSITAVGTLDSGFFGRNFYLKFICDYIEVEE